MMDKVRISVITVCYNAEKYIAYTIESVLKQNYSDFEYIIKDGCSTDREKCDVPCKITVRALFSFMLFAHPKPLFHNPCS